MRFICVCLYAFYALNVCLCVFMLFIRSVFEIVHKTHQRVLWKANIGPGQRVPIHSVTLDDPLLLRITLR